MTVECHIEKDNADYYLEAYIVDHFVNENNATKKIKTTRLAYIAGYKDYDQQSNQEALMLQLKNNLIDFYSSYPDGEVTIKLVITEDYVNP
jgi:hypothetical protein